MDEKPKKKRRKKPPIEIDRERLREYRENRARLRKYYEDIEAGAINGHEMPLKMPNPIDPETELAYLKQGHDDGNPVALARAGILCLTRDRPMDPWVKTGLLELLDEIIWRNPGNKKGGHPIDLKENLQIFDEFESWLDLTVETASGKRRRVTVAEAAERVWLDRNPGKKIDQAGANDTPELIKKYYLARKRLFAKDYRNRLLPQQPTYELTRLGVDSIGEYIRSALGACQLATTVSLPEIAALMGEHQYSVQELAISWNVSEDLIYRTFRNEPDVVFHGEGPRRKMMRIPESVALRVYLRKSLK